MAEMLCDTAMLIGVGDAETAARERVMDLLNRVDASTAMGDEAKS